MVLSLITLNLFSPALESPQALFPLAVGVVVFGLGIGGIIFWVVGKDMAGWLDTHVAAMDASRLGMRPALPRPFLETAAPGYLTDTDWDLLPGAEDADEDVADDADVKAPPGDVPAGPSSSGCRRHRRGVAVVIRRGAR